MGFCGNMRAEPTADFTEDYHCFCEVYLRTLVPGKLQTNRWCDVGTDALLMDAGALLNEDRRAYG